MKFALNSKKTNPPRTALTPIKNQRGQSLIEYLIIVAILGVGSIAVMSSVGQQINSRFAKVVKSLGGSVEDGATAAAQVTKAQTSRKNLSTFARGAAGASNNNGSGNSGSSKDSDE